MPTSDATISDQYPPTVDIEIDRERLKNYLCTKRLLSLTLPLAFYGGVFGGLTTTSAVGRGVTGGALVPILVRHIAAGIGVGVGCAILLYLIVARPLTLRYAASLKVAVEGAFLRVCEHTIVLSDRKLHFRAIVDYATTQGVLMRRFGIHALRMTTTAGGVGSTILIPGVKDCLSIRDMLGDIDRLRENQ